MCFDFRKLLRCDRTQTANKLRKRNGNEALRVESSGTQETYRKSHLEP